MATSSIFSRPSTCLKVLCLPKPRSFNHLNSRRVLEATMERDNQKCPVKQITFAWSCSISVIFSLTVCWRYTWCLAFAATLRQLNELSIQKEELSENLSSQVVCELMRYTQELKTERKSVRTYTHTHTDICNVLPNSKLCTWWKSQHFHQAVIYFVPAFPRWSSCPAAHWEFLETAGNCEWLLIVRVMSATLIKVKPAKSKFQLGLESSRCCCSHRNWFVWIFLMFFGKWRVIGVGKERSHDWLLVGMMLRSEHV